MTHDEKAIEAALDNLLKLWHQWSAGDGVGAGYPSVCTSCKLYRASRQHDYDYIDSDADNALAEAVEAQVSAIAEPWRTALHINARNLATGRSVWRSARLPADDMERAVVVTEARNKLMLRLHTAGLM